MNSNPSRAIQIRRQLTGAGRRLVCGVRKVVNPRALGIAGMLRLPELGILNISPSEHHATPNTLSEQP